MTVEATHTMLPAAPAIPTIHPPWVRVTHWVNAIAMLVMIGSGWEIYNASPLFPFVFPHWITLGGWLAGALLWHFAAMWVLAVNGLVYVGLGLATGRFRNKLLAARRIVGKQLTKMAELDLPAMLRERAPLRTPGQRLRCWNGQFAHVNHARSR